LTTPDQFSYRSVLQLLAALPYSITRLASEAGAEISHAALLVERGPVDDRVRRPSVLDIQHRLLVGGTITGES
jgi:hypothetical protein